MKKTLSSSSSSLRPVWRKRVAQLCCLIACFLMMAAVALQKDHSLWGVWNLNPVAADSQPVLSERGGTLVINSSIVTSAVPRDDIKVVKVPVTEMALEMGSAKVLNIIMLGAYVGYTQVVPEDVVWRTIEHKLGKKPKLLPLNKQAYEAGLKIGREAR